MREVERKETVMVARSAVIRRVRIRAEPEEDVWKDGLNPNPWISKRVPRSATGIAVFALNPAECLGNARWSNQSLARRANRAAAIKSKNTEKTEDDQLAA
jgi:hypothetical protein